MPLSARALKGITAGFVVLGFGLMFAGPSIVKRPADMSRRTYARRAAAYMGGFILAISGAGAGAFMLIRRARTEYRDQSMRNLKDLLEGAREDRLQKMQEASEADDE